MILNGWSSCQNAPAAAPCTSAPRPVQSGPYATSGIRYSTVMGPGGRANAVGGSVGVDLNPVPGDPEATIRKARAIRRAAFGPANPSAADHRVAAEAYRMEMHAKAELEKQKAAVGVKRRGSTCTRSRRHPRSAPGAS
jgi:hypothetical protein